MGNRSIQVKKFFFPIILFFITFFLPLKKKGDTYVAWNNIISQNPLKNGVHYVEVFLDKNVNSIKKNFIEPNFLTKQSIQQNRVVTSILVSVCQVNKTLLFFCSFVNFNSQKKKKKQPKN